MIKTIGKFINLLLKPFDFKISKINNYYYPIDASKRDIEIIDYILSFDDPKNKLSMVTVDKLMSVIRSTRYIIKNKIKGDFVECGVWRGGCSLAMAMILDDYKEDRKIYLFDTFEGMSMPGQEDTNYEGISAIRKFLRLKKNSYNSWCFASLDDVKRQFQKINLEKYAFFIKGDVLETLNKKNNIPENIAILRLDTDWYESTKLEMYKLYPRLIKHGVLLIDDYYDWQGCKKAIDEYFEYHNISDYSLMWGNYSAGKGLVKRE